MRTAFALSAATAKSELNFEVSIRRENADLGFGGVGCCHTHTRGLRCICSQKGQAEVSFSKILVFGIE